MTPSGLFAGLAGTLLLIAVLLYRAAWMMEREDAKRWERRARAAGWHPEITPQIADRIMSNLFPRPMGAPSVVKEVERLREYREHRALRGIDHHRRHEVAATCDSEAAREILTRTCGGLEVDE